MNNIMNKKGILVIIYTSIIVLGAVYFNYTSLSANVSEEKTSPSIVSDNLKQAAIPNDFYQEINLGENYTYNVTGFGLDAKWTNYTGSPDVNWKTDPGEQILVNFTGFYNRAPNVPVDSFPDTDMPWMNISIFEDKSGPSLNYTNSNVSNSEVARNLKLGFSGFQSGFLIKVNHTDWLMANATLEANGASGPKAQLTKEETYNFLYFRFEQYGAADNQKTELIYDKITGLLVWAKTSNSSYNLEIFLTEYALDFERQYVYNVNNWGKDGNTHAFWWGFHGYQGVFTTNPGGRIYINFNGYYGRDSSDFGDIFPDNQIVWFNISFEYKGDGGRFMAFEYNNISNPDAALIINLKYNSFASGFLVPNMNNETWLKENALEQGDPGGPYDIPGVVTIEETDLTIKITYDQIDGPQISSMRYEKRTGLLLWTDSIAKNYRLTMTIENYIPPTTTGSTVIVDDDDDDDDVREAIPSFPIIILISIAIFTTIILALRTKKIRLK